MNKVLIYLPLDPVMAKKENLPLKLPVLPEDMETIGSEDRIPLDVVLNGLRRQYEVSPDEYYNSYLVYFIYEKLKVSLAEKDTETAFELLYEIESKGLADFRFDFYRGIVLKNVGMFGEAEDSLRRALSSSPGNPVISFEIARLLDETDNFDEALEFYTRTIEADSRFLPAYMASADIFFRAKDYSTAQDLYLKCIGISEDFLPPYSRLGVIYNTEQKFDKAFEILKNGLKKFPEEVELHYNFSFACLRLGKPLMAIGHLKKSLELDENFTSAWNELAIIQKNFGFYEDAFNSICKAFETDSQNDSVIWNGYRISLICGRFSKAREFLAQAKNIDNPEKELLFADISKMENAGTLREHEFSIEGFAEWALNVYEDIPQDIRNTLNSIEEGVLAHREFDKIGDLRFIDFFRDILEEYSHGRIELEKALTLFSTACAGSTGWVAFSRAINLLLFGEEAEQNPAEFSFVEFEYLTDSMFDEIKDIDWELSKEISKYEYDRLRDWENILECWKYPCTLSEYLFLILELLRIEMNEDEEKMIKEYDENLYYILLKIKSRWKNA